MKARKAWLTYKFRDALDRENSELAAATREQAEAAREQTEKSNAADYTADQFASLLFPS